MAQSKPKQKVTTVREHSRRVGVSGKNPDGITTVDRHLRRLPGTYLGPEEIASTFKSYDKSKIVFPSVGTIKEFKSPDSYDDLIAVWVDYFNKTLKVEPPLDPDVLKALIASESGFRKDPPGNPTAIGFAQITRETFEIVQDPRGEAKQFIFNKIRLKDLKDPNIAVPIAARWLSRKKVIAKSKLGRDPTAEEIILEYKGLLKSNTKFKDNALASFRKYYAILKTK
ncbi:MAG: transglycosylase SLT domain-containing protein [Bdellovibrionaceae bacterium]|nr:transglycosylase SLT domain-containing protein [Pseudobdellovibrionaceae bacterium]